MHAWNQAVLASVTHKIHSKYWSLVNHGQLQRLPAIMVW